MDYKSLVNRESFKNILLHHVKNELRSEYCSSFSKDVQEKLKRGEPIDQIISSTCATISQSSDFKEFKDKVLQSIEQLMDDSEEYVPKDGTDCGGSQSSSASSTNISSIDYLSPEQFQAVTKNLLSGTKAEKLEALETFHRLPSFEQLMNPSLWTDVQKGLFDALKSDTKFLKEAALRLYIKMLTSPESKAVLESYLSLRKFMTEHLLLSMNVSDNRNLYRLATEIISIKMKFLQNISSYWLRYPQSVIESITMNSLSIFLDRYINISDFDVWNCVSCLDPEAKWMKNLMFEQTSRKILLKTLKNVGDILPQAIGYCDTFYNEHECAISSHNCCINVVDVAMITHVICFLSHILQYNDGRAIFIDIQYGDSSICWTDVFKIVMRSALKLATIACFKCCTPIFENVPNLWSCVFQESREVHLNLFLKEMLTKDFNKIISLNRCFLILECFSKAFDLVNADLSAVRNMSGFVTSLLQQCINLISENNSFCRRKVTLHYYHSSLIFVQKCMKLPSFVFLDHNFIRVLTELWAKVKHNFDSNSLNDPAAIQFHGKENISIFNQGVRNMVIHLLSKPIGVYTCRSNSSFEFCLNFLLKKILSDIKTKNTICSRDLFVLSTALDKNLTMNIAVHKTIASMLSSVIWHLADSSLDTSKLPVMRNPLEMIVPCVIQDFVTKIPDVDADSQLFHHILLFPKIPTESIFHEDYYVLCLQVISTLLSSVSITCTLEAKFKITDLFLTFQKKKLNGHDKPIIEPILILQNIILVKLFSFGGPTERILPSETLENGDYEWPFFSEFPVPEKYYPARLSQESPVVITDQSFDYRGLIEIYAEYASSGSDMNTNTVLKCFENIYNINRSYSEPQTVETVLTEQEKAGVVMAERYGRSLNLLDDDDGQLASFLMSVKQLIKSDGSDIDVFASTLFLVCKGDSELTMFVLKMMKESESELFVWSNLRKQKDAAMYSGLLELCDIIVETRLPKVSAAFRISGALPSALFSFWTSQCYWNYLDFTQIANFVLVSVIFSGKYSVFFFVSVLLHLQDFIVENAHSGNLFLLLKKSPIENYDVYKYFNFMQELSLEFAKFFQSLSERLQCDNSDGSCESYEFDV